MRLVLKVLYTRSVHSTIPVGFAPVHLGMKRKSTSIIYADLPKLGTQCPDNAGIYSIWEAALAAETVLLYNSLAKRHRIRHISRQLDSEIKLRIPLLFRLESGTLQGIKDVVVLKAFLQSFGFVVILENKSSPELQFSYTPHQGLSSRILLHSFNSLST